MTGPQLETTCERPKVIFLQGSFSFGKKTGKTPKNRQKLPKFGLKQEKFAVDTRPKKPCRIDSTTDGRG
jgi:hypothetical protein